MEGIVEIFW